MAGIKDLSESRGTLVNFDPRKLKVKSGLNARDFNDPASIEHVETICASIMARGFLNSRPLEIFQVGDDVFVSDGECRLRASMLAIERGLDLRTVPCVPEARGTSEADRFLNQNLSNGGRNLTLAEQGKNIQRAQALGVPLDEIAKKLGRSQTYVANALDFLAAPTVVHELVSRGKVSATLAAKTVRQEGGEKATQTLAQAVEKAAERGSTKAKPRDVEAKPQTMAEYLKPKFHADFLRLTRELARFFADLPEACQARDYSSEWDGEFFDVALSVAIIREAHELVIAYDLAFKDAAQ